jgi:hypothetical protein
MGVPSETEKVALGDAGPLVRFAAERIKDLDPSLTLAIAESLEDAKSESWTPQLSQKFWSAFNKLCLLIQPTTMDCLATSNKRLDAFSPVDFKKIKVSPAELTSTRYLWSLLGALVIPRRSQNRTHCCSPERTLVERSSAVALECSVVARSV